MKMKKQSALEDVQGFDLTREKYVHLDCERWLKDHRIRERGRKRGKQNQPNSEQEQPDEIFREIKSWVENRARKCNEDVNRYINEALHNLHTLCTTEGDENPEIQIEHVITRHCQNLETMTNQSVSDLTKQQQEYQDASRDLENFRENNGLLRVAHYPENRIAHWMWVFAAGIVETFLSANLLGSVSRGGVIEGWMIAVVLTAVNIILGILAGRIWTSTHFGWGRKLLACCLGILCVAVALIWNDVAGHVRDVYVLAEQTGKLETVDEAFATAWQAMIKRPLPWASLASAGLAFIGVAVFLLTAYKAYRADDPFPGYGAKHRKVKELHERYQSNLNDELKRLKSTYDRAGGDIEEIKARYEADQVSWKSTCDKLRTIRDGYPVNLQQYNHDLSYLLAAYCDANRDARTSPEPPFFKSKPTIDGALLDPLEFPIPEDPAWGDIPTKSKEGFARVNETYEQQWARFKMLYCV